MTDDQDTREEQARKTRGAEKLRARAMRKFGQAIFDAAKVFESELAEHAGSGEFERVRVRDVMPYGDDYLKATPITAFLGMAFQHAASGGMSFDERQTLRRLHAALRPASRPKDEAIDLAASIIDDYARMYIEATSSDARPPPPAPYTKWMSPENLILSLRTALTVQVHKAFLHLEGKEYEIAQLLGRFSAGKGRNPKSGEASKLTAAGILEQLNKLAEHSDSDGTKDRPLGIGLTARGIDNARARQRDTSRQL